MLNVVQGNVLRFLPSFLLEREHVDTTTELLYELLNATRPHAEQQESLVGAAAQ